MQPSRHRSLIRRNKSANDDQSRNIKNQPIHVKISALFELDFECLVNCNAMDLDYVLSIASNEENLAACLIPLSSTAENFVQLMKTDFKQFKKLTDETKFSNDFFALMFATYYWRLEVASKNILIVHNDTEFLEKILLIQNGEQALQPLEVHFKRLIKAYHIGLKCLKSKFNICKH